MNKMTTLCNLDKFIHTVKNLPAGEKVGKVLRIIGLVIEADGPEASIGDLCYIFNSMNEKPVFAEVVGFQEKKIQQLASLNKVCKKLALFAFDVKK